MYVQNSVPMRILDTLVPCACMRAWSVAALVVALAGIGPKKQLVKKFAPHALTVHMRLVATGTRS